MGDSIRIEITEDVRPTLREIARRGRDMRPILSTIGQIGVDAVEENFAAEGRPTRWRPRKRPRKGYKILTLSGRLRRSVHYAVSGGNQVSIGTNVVYASVHNRGYRGTQRVRGHQRRVTQAFGKPLSAPVICQVAAHSRRMVIPKREFLYIPPADYNEIEATIADWILKERRR